MSREYGDRKYKQHNTSVRDCCRRIHGLWCLFYLPWVYTHGYLASTASRFYKSTELRGVRENMDITILQAASMINMAEVIAVPTETVYGLAASLYQPTAIDKIFSLKGRPANNPLIIHVAEAKDVLNFAENLPEDFHKLAEKFWPGPLTLVLPIIKEKISTRVVF